AKISPGNPRPVVEAELMASLNGRALSICIPEESQLSEEAFTLGPFDWIAPLNTPLPAVEQRIALVRTQGSDIDPDTVESAPSSEKTKTAEPVLAPGISEADEEWFQAAYPAHSDEE
ncbi:hypothetical protein, partial [Symmachiella dynata]|uniref:hypothetical protein n=1 Tax=Symmachiella dynata TaxID=2527995 RepID=UPI0030EC2D03